MEREYGKSVEFSGLAMDHALAYQSQMLPYMYTILQINC